MCANLARRDLERSGAVEIPTRRRPPALSPRPQENREKKETHAMDQPWSINCVAFRLYYMFLLLFEACVFVCFGRFSLPFYFSLFSRMYKFVTLSLSPVLQYVLDLSIIHI